MSFVKRGEFVISSDPAPDESNNKEAVQIATLTDGTFIMVWDSDNQAEGGVADNHSIHAQRYKNKKIDGYFHPEAQYGGSKPLLPILERIGSEFMINQGEGGTTGHRCPKIAALADNKFVVAWERDANEGSGTAPRRVYCRFFEATDDTSTPTVVAAGPDANSATGTGNLLVATPVNAGSWMFPRDIIVVNQNPVEIIFLFTDDGGVGPYKKDLFAMMWRGFPGGASAAGKRWANSMTIANDNRHQGGGGSAENFIRETAGPEMVVLNDKSLLITWDDGGPAAVDAHAYCSVMKRYKVNNGDGGMNGAGNLVAWTGGPVAGLLVNSAAETHDSVDENAGSLFSPKLLNLGTDNAGNQYVATLYLHFRKAAISATPATSGYCDIHMGFTKVKVAVPETNAAGIPINVGPTHPYRIENSATATATAARKGWRGFDGCILKGNKGVLVWTSESRLDGTLMTVSTVGTNHGTDEKLTQLHGRIFTYTLGNGDVTINSWGDVFSVSNNNVNKSCQYPRIIPTEGRESFMVVWQQEQTSNTKDFVIVGNQYVPQSWLIENMRPKPNAIFPEPASVVNQYHQYEMSKAALNALSEANSSNGNTTKKRAYRPAGSGFARRFGQKPLGNGGIRTPSALAAGTMDRLARLKAAAIAGTKN